MGRRKIAVGSWAFLGGPSGMGIGELAKNLGILGFDGVALAGIAPHADPALFSAREDRLRLQNAFFDNHLEVLEFMPDAWRFNPLIREGEYLDCMENAIRFMDECGFRILRVDTCCPPRLPDGISLEKALAKTVEVFRHLAKQCAARNISVVWEFEPGFIFNRPSEVVRILDSVCMANFNLLFDTSHAHMCGVVGAGQLGEKETLKGGVGEFAGLVSGKIGSVHLADSDGTLVGGDGTSAHVPFGTGLVDFDEAVPAILNAGAYRFGWWTIDLLPPTNLEEAARAKEFVDRLNARHF